MVKKQKKSKSIFMIGIAVTVLLVTIILPGCIYDDDNDKKKKSETPGLPITVVDDMGRSITIYEYPERIVSMAPSTTEILYELNLGDKIVGVDSASNYPEEAKNHEVVFTYQVLDEEKLVEIDPDLVILNHRLDLSEVARDAIEGYGYNLIILNPVVVEDVLDNIELIGKVTNRVEEADTLIDAMQTRIDDVVETTQSSIGEISNVLYVLYYDGSADPWVAGEKTYVDDIISKAGGRNIISGSDDFIQ
jgi:iron complex transport system substrate-binding protein